MPLKSRGITLGLLAAVCSLACLTAGCARKVDPTEAVFADFAKRLDDYVVLRQHMADSVGVLDETKSQQEIAARAAMLADRIIAARAQAKPGDIFTTEVSSVLVTLIQEEHKRRPLSVRDSREDAQQELPDFEPHVNQIYPTTYPLATFPATLLPLLPALPEQIEYRIVGRWLILRDVEANVIIDVMPNAVP